MGFFFYSYQFIPEYSGSFYKSKQLYQEKIDANNAALKKVKLSAKESESYKEYLMATAEKTAVKKEYFKVKENEKVFGFKSLRFFWERFSLFSGLLIYALVNLFRSFYFERKNTGIKILHTVILFNAVFNLLWVFNTFQDFSQICYLLAVLVIVIGLLTAVHFITRYQDHYINTLKSRILKLADFTIKNTKENKKAEMVRLLDSLKNEK